MKFSPGNHSVHVTTGLMAILDHEDEIAGILAHEAGHIQLGHYNSSVGRSLLWGLLFHALEGNAARRLPEGWAGPGRIGLQQEQEVAADDYGIRTASAAGYSPGAVRAMEKMRPPDSRPPDVSIPILHGQAPSSPEKQRIGY